MHHYNWFGINLSVKQSNWRSWDSNLWSVKFVQSTEMGFAIKHLCIVRSLRISSKFKEAHYPVIYWLNRSRFGQRMHITSNETNYRPTRNIRDQLNSERAVLVRIPDASCKCISTNTNLCILCGGSSGLTTAQGGWLPDLRRITIACRLIW